jgi:hypothetical protein
MVLWLRHPYLTPIKRNPLRTPKRWGFCLGGKVLTNKTERDIIMANFDESKIKRDKDGKFAEQNARKAQDLERKFNDDLPVAPKESLSKKEWALWYKAVAENKALGYWAEELDDKNAILKIENNNSHKIVITGGTFETPKAKEIYSFSSADEMNDYIEVLKDYDKQ